VSFTAKLGGRLIVNQAGGVLENAGLCIHPHFNAPYIPGSAIKGCARHAAWQAWNEAEEGDAKIAAAKEVAEIFGFPTGDSKPKKEEDVDPNRVYLDEYLKDKCEYKEGDSHSGKVAFLAAVPETTAKLVVDIVNCHHKDYYAGKETKPYATDDETPIPNFFPAVDAGVSFKFTIVPIGVHNLTERALHWLKIGLSQNGIGAKTAAGYGWFDIDMTDYSSIKPDADLIAQWETKYSSATKQKKEFFKSNDYLLCQDDPIRLMSVWDFITKKDWWQKEKKNSGSLVTREMLGIAQKIGREA
jgi:CRISPR type III-B/RAMP module RAMP protein Cmr6